MIGYHQSRGGPSVIPRTARKLRIGMTVLTNDGTYATVTKRVKAQGHLSGETLYRIHLEGAPTEILYEGEVLNTVAVADDSLTVQDPRPRHIAPRVSHSHFSTNDLKALKSLVL